MNRSIINVLFGGAMGVNGGSFWTKANKFSVTIVQVQRMMRALMSNADSVVIKPGYGMAQGRAQNAVKELCEIPERTRCKSSLCDSPSLQVVCQSYERTFAEADVAYEDILEMDEINSDFLQLMWCL